MTAIVNYKLKYFVGLKIIRKIRQISSFFHADYTNKALLAKWLSPKATQEKLRIINISVEPGSTQGRNEPRFTNMV